MTDRLEQDHVHVKALIRIGRRSVFCSCVKPIMMLPDTRLLAIFAGTFVVAYVVWNFMRDTRKRGTSRPPTLWSLPLIGSIFFLPDFQIWHKEFLKMSAKIGNVFAFYIGSQYVSCILLLF